MDEGKVVNRIQFGIHYAAEELGTYIDVNTRPDRSRSGWRCKSIDVLETVRESTNHHTNG